MQSKNVKYGCLYIIKQEGSNYYKIGHTVQNIKDRMITLQCGNPNKLTLIQIYTGTLTEIKRLERLLHSAYIQHNKLNEWFTFDEDTLLKVHRDICRKLGINENISINSEDKYIPTGKYISTYKDEYKSSLTTK
jgi:hypothetical protein